MFLECVHMLLYIERERNERRKKEGRRREDNEFESNSRGGGCGCGCWCCGCPNPLTVAYVHTYLYSLFSFLLTSCMKYRFLQTTRAHIQTKYAATIYNIQLYNPILLELHSGDICCIS